MESLDQILRNAVQYSVSNGRCFVYFLFRDGEIIYVGSTKNLYMRLGQHEKSKNFDAYSVLDVDIADLENTEAFYVLSLSPQMNSVVPKNTMFISYGKAKKLVSYMAIRRSIKSGVIKPIESKFGMYFKTSDVLSILEAS